MDKKKVIYIGILMIITVIVSITYFSYAFFTHKSEQHGKLNIVAGTLNYKIESDDLNNNSLIIKGNTTKKIDLSIKSLNEISTRYELSYDTGSDNIEVGYLTNNTKGEIGVNDEEIVTLLITNPTSTEEKITFRVEGGFINNTLERIIGKEIISQEVICSTYSEHIWNFDYTGTAQEFITPCDGVYKLEIWGAQGGNNYDMVGYNEKQLIPAYGGYGGYSVGNIREKQNDKLYIFVGEQGKTTYNNNTITPNIEIYAYPNGGAVRSKRDNQSISYNGGGGSTHIAKEKKLISDFLSTSDNLLIVAGAGGGVSNWWGISSNAGSGGGYIGNSTETNYNDINAIGGTQSSGGLGGGNSNRDTYAGQYGFGGGSNYANTNNLSGAGGGGYYGGGASWGASGAGGSGYIANANLTDKHMSCYNCATSSDTDTNTITNTCHSISATADCAKEGNGYARITYLGN